MVYPRHTIEEVSQHRDGEHQAQGVCKAQIPVGSKQNPWTKGQIAKGSSSKRAWRQLKVGENNQTLEH